MSASRPQRGVIDKAVYRGIEPKSRSQKIFTGPFEYDGWKNNLELRAMTSVLQIKLREVLREDLGGTYGVWVSSSGSQHPDEEYRIIHLLRQRSRSRRGN